MQRKKLKSTNMTSSKGKAINHS